MQNNFVVSSKIMSEKKSDLVFSYDHVDSGIIWVVHCSFNNFYRRGVARTRDRARCKVREAINELRLVISRRASTRRRISEATSYEKPEHIKWLKKADTERGFRSEIVRSPAIAPS